MNINFDAKTNKYFFVSPSGRKYSSPNKSYVEYQYGRAFGTAADTNNSVDTVDQAPQFDVNSRFEILARNVQMVAAGLQKSLVLCGSGGLGKSFTVSKILKQCGFSKVAEGCKPTEGEKNYVVIKGRSTAKALYRDLYENNGCVVVFDDAAVEKDPTAVDLLKAALDSTDERVISWRSAGVFGDDLPQSFLFTGTVIFISNRRKEDFPQAILSRATSIDLEMTDDEKIERMGVILKEDDFMPDVPMNYKEEALEMISRVRKHCKEISMRSLIKVTNIRQMFSGKEFEETAIYTLTN